MIEKITLDMLTKDTVSVKKQEYTVADGKEYAISEPWRRAYTNSNQGRQQVENEIPDPYKSVIFIIWGNEPTMVEENN